MENRHAMPGGLRVQALVGISILLAVALGSTGIVVERVVARTMQQHRSERAYELAQVIASGRWTDESLESLVSGEATDGVRIVREGESTDFGAFPPRHEVVQSGGVVGVGNSDELRVEVVVLGERLEQDRASARALIWSFLSVGFIAILAFAYAMFTFLVIRPLRAIGVATERASSGDLASPISILPRNEFGQVGKSFNRMLVLLDRRRDEVEKSLAELREANAQLRSAQESLIRSEKLASVGQLAAGVAHEVGNPLAAASGYAELLGDESMDPAERAEVLQRLGAQLDRIQSIIRGLLDFSRDEPAVRVGRVDPFRVARASLELVEGVSDARGVAFEVDVSKETPAVRASESHLEQVLVNLLMNAVDATSGVDGGCVSLRATWDEEQVRISVEDNGSGIAEDVKARIFDPFFTTKEPGQGTGLGLAICARIVESFGGDLILVSTDPTRFEVVLHREDL